MYLSLNYDMTILKESDRFVAWLFYQELKTLRSVMTGTFFEESQNLRILLEEKSEEESSSLTDLIINLTLTEPEFGVFA